MTSESSFFFATACASGALALMLGLHWRRNGGHGGIGYWTVAAALFSSCNLGFFIGHQAGWLALVLIARTWVTVAYGALFLGAQGSVGRPPRVVAMVLALVLNGVVAATLLGGPELFPARVMLSRLVWGACCLLAYRVLREANRHFRDGPAAPAKILFYHGLYLMGRALVIGGMWASRGDINPPVLVAIDYAAAVVFDVTLFVGLLMAHHQIRSDELASMRVELQTVSGLLPVCAWCERVRDDEGYWHEVNAYLKRQAAGRITHGMCHHCSEKMGLDVPPEEPSAPRRPVCRPVSDASR